MECPLNGVPVAGPDDRNDRHYRTTRDRTAAESFLNRHPTAKILFIVDTHSLENGFFIYAGDSPQDYLACSLLEVGSSSMWPSHISHVFPKILRDCSPPGVFKFLSNSDKSPKHQHKSLILNLSCGSSISQAGARSRILDG